MEIQYLTTQQIAESNCYPFTLGQIRHYLLMRHRNGLHKVVRKIGKRLYLRRDLFEDWIEAQSNSSYRERLSLKERYLIYENEKKNPDPTMNYEDWAKDRINALNI